MLSGDGENRLYWRNGIEEVLGSRPRLARPCENHKRSMESALVPFPLPFPAIHEGFQPRPRREFDHVICRAATQAQAQQLD